MEIIEESFYLEKLEPEKLDAYLSEGYRHFGSLFFRYNVNFLNDKLALILPLRVNLSTYKHKKKHRRILNKNKTLQHIFRPVFIDKEKEELFYLHRARFKDNIPDSIYSFISDTPSSLPCESLECAVYDKDKLVAYSFLDIGSTSTSSVYAVFHPDYAKTSPGIFTMLLEIEYSIQQGKSYYYPGYCFFESSFYDYKKQFEALEFYDWNHNWLPLGVINNK
ncbi:MAG: arginine-tRNA-protein transferase [Leptospiraceae bacterium]|nr:hypothetical protein [Leptospiraceae bacterium]MCP5501444.1 arginine-tRNA-protein transferase [Leptospiraceae bacterium]